MFQNDIQRTPDFCKRFVTPTERSFIRLGGRQVQLRSPIKKQLKQLLCRILFAVFGGSLKLHPEGDNHSIKQANPLISALKTVM